MSTPFDPQPCAAVGPGAGGAFLADIVLCDVTPGGTVSFLRKFVQSVGVGGVGQVDSFSDFVLDGSAPYVPTGAVRSCDSAMVDQEPACWTQTSTGATVHSGTIRHDSSLPAPGWVLFDQNVTSVSPAEPGLTFVPCGQADPITTTGLCLGNGTPIGVVVRRNATTGVLVEDGWINLLTGAFTSGNPPAGTIACGDTANITTSGILCDIDGGGNVVGLVIVQYQFNPDGSVASTTLLNAVTGAPYTPTGTVTTCPTGTELPDQDLVILCDNNGAFLRDYRRDETGAVVAVSDYTVAGVPYATVGPVGTCAGRDQEIMVLCDSAATPVRFLRRYNYNLQSGALVSTVDTTLDGTTPFVPTGAVGVCTTDVATLLDFAEEVLCDSNGTSFIRRFTFNSQTGAVVSTVNLTLAGAAFVPVGAVAVCTAACCPVVVGEGCTNTGSGRYTAIRSASGTVTYIDSVTGAAVLVGNIVACPSATVVPSAVTLNSQARLVGDADAAWTPGADVTGTLTSVTFTVLSGTATLTDQSGTVLAGLPVGYSATWSAEDHSTLLGPQSIDAIGGNTVVIWTQK